MQKCHLDHYLPKLGKKLQLNLYAHEYANFNFLQNYLSTKAEMTRFEKNKPTLIPKRL